MAVGGSFCSLRGSLASSPATSTTVTVTAGTTVPFRLLRQHPLPLLYCHRRLTLLYCQLLTPLSCTPMSAAPTRPPPCPSPGMGSPSSHTWWVRGQGRRCSALICCRPPLLTQHPLLLCAGHPVSARLPHQLPTVGAARCRHTHVRRGKGGGQGGEEEEGADGGGLRGNGRSAAPLDEGHTEMASPPS